MRAATGALVDIKTEGAVGEHQAESHKNRQNLCDLGPVFPSTRRLAARLPEIVGQRLGEIGNQALRVIDQRRIVGHGQLSC